MGYLEIFDLSDRIKKNEQLQNDMQLRLAELRQAIDLNLSADDETYTATVTLPVKFFELSDFEKLNSSVMLKLRNRKKQLVRLLKTEVANLSEPSAAPAFVKDQT